MDKFQTPQKSSQFVLIFAKNVNFLKTSEGYNFKGREMCFWILVLYIQDKIHVWKNNENTLQ